MRLSCAAVCWCSQT